MRYKLINEENNGRNDYKNIVLENRGIKNINTYLNLNKNHVHHYELLDNIEVAVQKLLEAINENKHISIVVDSDVDGFTSAAILYDYIVNKMEYDNVSHILHTGKQHGLSDDAWEQIDFEKVGLIMLPDAGTNDWERCFKLSEKGIETIILDHHEKDDGVSNGFAIIVNNQICDYPNKALCGVGIVYKFLQALDDELWTEYAKEYIDMVALGNIGDVMDLRSYETKYLADKGLRNIKNPLFMALIKKQSYSLSNSEIPTLIDVAFYIVPLINAMIRVGTQEEKDMLFRAFTGQYEEFEYTPRKSKNNPNPKPTKENIYDRVARLCGNAKARQSKMVEKSLDEIITKYEKYNNKNIIFFANVTGVLDSSLTGLVAMKIADRFQKPTLLLRENKSQSAEECKVFSGSARNVNDGAIENLKDELNDSGLFIEALGHQGAFGLSIKNNDIKTAIEYFNKKYKDTYLGKVYRVDFVFDGGVEYQYIKEIESMKNLFSSTVKEPLIAIRNLKVNALDIEFMSNGKHLKFNVDGVTYIKFNVKPNEKISNLYDDVVMDIVGKTSINMFNSIATPQVIVEGYEIREG